MEEHDIVQLNDNYRFTSRGSKNGVPFCYDITIPKGTKGTIVSEFKGDGYWVEFPIFMFKDKGDDGVHFIEANYLETVKSIKEMI